MARKILVAKIKSSELLSMGSSVKPELSRLAYVDKVWFENGAYHIQGRKAIQTFVRAMEEQLTELRELFKDSESIKEFDHDERYLKTLLKAKAS